MREVCSNPVAADSEVIEVEIGAEVTLPVTVVEMVTVCVDSGLPAYTELLERVARGSDAEGGVMKLLASMPDG